MESIHPPPASQLPTSDSPEGRVAVRAAGAVSGSTATATADTKLAITKEPTTRTRGSNRAALGLLAALAGAGAFAWTLLPSTGSPTKETQGSASATADRAPVVAAKAAQAAPVVDSEVTPSKGEDGSDQMKAAGSEVAAEPPADSRQNSTSATPGAKKATKPTGAAENGATTRELEGAGNGTFSVNVRVQHGGRSCAAQPGGTQLTLVVGDFSQSRTVTGCRATFEGVPSKYEGKTASFAGSGSLCRLSGGGALGANMMVGAKRRGAPCSADGVAACECKNPCLGHECL
jgi:hypothetical protein